MDHPSVIVAVVGLIIWIIGLTMVGQSGQEIKAWGSKPASELTKGDVLLLVILLGWLSSAGKEKS
jgi:hypothetical protein